MADKGHEPVWPLPSFRFKVLWDGAEIGFQAVSGLDVGSEPQDYRAGNARAVSQIRMPGLDRPSTVVMEKGSFAKGHLLWDWYNEIAMNRIKRRDVTIALIDYEGAVVMTWKMKNAFPIKLVCGELDAKSSEIAIDSVEFAHSGLTAENG